MSRLGMLIRVTARAVLSIERGGQFCGPWCITWCSSLADHRRRSSDPRRWVLDSWKLNGEVKTTVFHTKRGNNCVFDSLFDFSRIIVLEL